MQSFCDLETEQMTAARFAPAGENASVRRESWLDRLARRLAANPAEQMPIAPMHLHTAQLAVRCHRQTKSCVTHAA